MLKILPKKSVSAGIAAQPSSVAPVPVVSSQRHGLPFGLFVIWMLSLPFYSFSLVGTYSLDNLLAPLLCIVALILPGVRNSLVRGIRVRAIAILLALYLIYTLAGLVPVINSSELFWHKTWLSIRDLFYLLIPALYVRDRWSWGVTKGLVIYNAIVGAVTAFLASVGILHLELSRFEASRLGIAWLPKSIGLYSSYGDMAMLYAFTVTILVSHGYKDLYWGLSSRMGKILIWLMLIVGIAGMQSRNIIVASIVALMTYWLVRRFMVSSASGRGLIIGLMISMAIAVSGILMVFGGDLAESISHWGGANAYTTAEGRLLSYRQAIDLIVMEPLFGVSGPLYAKWAGLVESIHNLWLRVLLQNGFVGFLAILGMFVLAFRSGVNAAKYTDFTRDAAIALGSLAAIFIAVEFYPGLSDVLRLALSLIIASHWVAASGHSRNDRTV